METRKCKECGNDFDLTVEFFPVVNNINGRISYRSYCKPCFNKARKKKRKTRSIKDELKIVEVEPSEVESSIEIRCKECGDIKNESEFHKNKGTKTGRTGKCKKCVKEDDDKRRGRARFNELMSDIGEDD